MQITTRKPKSGEYQELRALRLKALKEFPTAFSSDYNEELQESEEKYKEWISNSIGESGSLMLCAYVEDKMVGMVSGTWKDKKKVRHVVEIGGVYVDSDYQGKGIGKKLFTALLQKLKSMNRFEKFYLSVNIENKKAQDLYASFGFKQTGILGKDLICDGKYYDLIEMELYL